MMPLLAAGALSKIDFGKVAKWTGLIIVVAVALFFIRKKIKNWNDKRENTHTNIITGDKGMANILADRARTAMKGWGTNEQTLYDIAKLIANGQSTFEDVAQAYYRKFERSLADDIRSELSSSDLAKFYELLGKPINGLYGVEQYLS